MNMYTHAHTWTGKAWALGGISSALVSVCRVTQPGDSKVVLPSRLVQALWLSQGLRVEERLRNFDRNPRQYEGATVPPK